MSIFQNGLCFAGNCNTASATDEKMSAILDTLQKSFDPCAFSILNPVNAVNNVSISVTPNATLNFWTALVTNRTSFLADMKKNEVARVQISFRQASIIVPAANTNLPVNSLTLTLQSTLNPSSNKTYVFPNFLRAVYVPNQDLSAGILQMTEIEIPDFVFTKKCLDNYNVITFAVSNVSNAVVFINFNLSKINPTPPSN